MSAINNERLIWSVAEGVGFITFDCPETLNALDAENLSRRARLLVDAGRDPAVRSLLITGTGTAFCTGHDLRALDNVAFGGDAVRLWNPILLALDQLPKPMVAAINGTAVGAGLNVALACDLVYAFDGAMLGQSFVWIGASPDTGAHSLLQQSIGTAKAAEILYLGRKFTGREAEEMGLIVRSFPSLEELQRSARVVAVKLAQGPSVAHAVIKRGLKYARLHQLPELLEWEADQETEVTKTQDFLEGITAFAQKRQPRFVGS